MGDAKVEVKWNAKGDSERVRRRFASPFSTSFASPFTTFASPFNPLRIFWQCEVSLLSKAQIFISKPMTREKIWIKIHVVSDT